MSGDASGKVRLSRRIGDSLRAIAEVAAEAEALCAAEGADESQSLRIGLALDEIAANALLHGATNEARPDILVELWIGGRDLTLRVSARGPRFDPREPRERDPDDYSIGGRGLTMVFAFADELTYRREAGRNITTFTVRKHGAPEVE